MQAIRFHEYGAPDVLALTFPHVPGVDVAGTDAGALHGKVVVLAAAS